MEMKIFPLLDVVVSVTEDAPIWGLSLFRPFGAKMCKVSITSGAASALLQPFDQEIWGFLGTFCCFGRSSTHMASS